MYCSISLQYSSSAGGIASATSGSRVDWTSTCNIHIHCANGLFCEFKEKQFLSLHILVEGPVRKARIGAYHSTKRAGAICPSNRFQMAKAAAARKVRGLVSWHITQWRTIQQFHSDRIGIKPGEATTVRGALYHPD